MDILQEKFQVDYPRQGNDDGQKGWASDNSARAKKGMPGREGHAGGDPTSKAMNNAVGFNSLPPGTDMEDQEVTDQREFKTVMSGQTDVSRDWNEQAQKTGYTRRAMRATDDEYSNAHNDAFYDEIKVDGDVGFAERNNVLDRM